MGGKGSLSRLHTPELKRGVMGSIRAKERTCENLSPAAVQCDQMLDFKVAQFLPKVAVK